MAFSTPLICCSSGVMTVSAMVFGEAPGYWPLTTTVGGTICGYSLMGRPGMASRPATVMMMARTVAKIGRSMKNDEMFMGGLSLRGRRRGGGRPSGGRCDIVGAHDDPLGCDHDPRVHPLRTVDHNHVTRFQSLVHHSQSID